MTWTYAALLVAGLMPVLCAGIAKAGLKNYDNHEPRAWMAQQTGYRSRANAAQANSFEAFPFFAVGILLAIQSGGDASRIEALAMSFVLARLAYIACYLADKATWRSIFWAAGYGCVIALYVTAILARG